MDEVRVDKCSFCHKEKIMCWHFIDDNGYTEEAICKDCLNQAVQLIEEKENG